MHGKFKEWFQRLKLTGKFVFKQLNKMKLILY